MLTKLPSPPKFHINRLKIPATHTCGTIKKHDTDPCELTMVLTKEVLHLLLYRNLHGKDMFTISTHPPPNLNWSFGLVERYLRSKIWSHSRFGRGHSASQGAMGCSVVPYFFQRFGSRSTLSIVGPRTRVWGKHYHMLPWFNRSPVDTTNVYNALRDKNIPLRLNATKGLGLRHILHRT